MNGLMMAIMQYLAKLRITPNYPSQKTKWSAKISKWEPNPPLAALIICLDWGITVRIYESIWYMNFLKKSLKWIFIGAVVLFAALQFTNPPHTNPPVKNDFLARMNPPPKIAAMFKSACYDCHSHETRWPWYSSVAPMSWKIAQDVDEGRVQLNLSDWPSDPKRAWKKMENMSEEIDQKDMPLKKYMILHKDAQLTDDERSELTQWLDKQADMLKSQAGAP